MTEQLLLVHSVTLVIFTNYMIFCSISPFYYYDMHELFSIFIFLFILISYHHLALLICNEFGNLTTILIRGQHAQKSQKSPITKNQGF